MNDNSFAVLHTGQALPRGKIPRASFQDFRQTIMNGVAKGQRVAAFFAAKEMDGTHHAPLDLYAVLADSAHGHLRVGKTTLDSDRFPSLTPDCPQVHLFEREIAEQYGVFPEGHPWLKPVRWEGAWGVGVAATR